MTSQAAPGVRREEHLQGGQLLGRGPPVGRAEHHEDADAGVGRGVIGVRPVDPEAPALEHGAHRAPARDGEVVADVVPAFGVHVVVLEGAPLSRRRLHADPAVPLALPVDHGPLLGVVGHERTPGGRAQAQALAGVDHEVGGRNRGAPRVQAKPRAGRDAPALAEALGHAGDAPGFPGRREGLALAPRPEDADLGRRDGRVGVGSAQAVQGVLHFLRGVRPVDAIHDEARPHVLRLVDQGLEPRDGRVLGAGVREAERHERGSGGQGGHFRLLRYAHLNSKSLMVSLALYSLEFLQQVYQRDHLYLVLPEVLPTNLPRLSYI